MAGFSDVHRSPEAREGLSLASGIVGRSSPSSPFFLVSSKTSLPQWNQIGYLNIEYQPHMNVIGEFEHQSGVAPKQKQ